ncbi:unnamed protein product [Arabidopsis halleri]
MKRDSSKFWKTMKIINFISYKLLKKVCNKRKIEVYSNPLLI